MKIRYETVGDADGIRAVVTQAFARPAEADLVDALRAADAPRISLVADAAGMVVGHVLFTRVTVRRGDDGWSALALGPLAVLPSQQGHGVGSRLIREGLADEVVLFTSPKPINRHGVAALSDAARARLANTAAYELTDDGLAGSDRMRIWRRRS